MPRGDRTGPLGMGPMTGRAAGYCAGYTVPGYMNVYGGRGMAFRRGFHGRGGGFGRERGFGFLGYPGVMPGVPGVPFVSQPGFGPEPYDERAELEELRSHAREIENTLSGIQKRIEELEAKGSAEKGD